MSYQEIDGDLFTAGLPAIGHGCNAQGVMGAGIAWQFRIRYPLMFAQYNRRCARGILTVDSRYMEWVEADGTVIFNLLTQPTPGPTASLDLITGAVRAALDACARWHIKALGIPRIGCGLGGLQWPDVRTALQEVAADPLPDFPQPTLVVVSLKEN